MTKTRLYKLIILFASIICIVVLGKIISQHEKPIGPASTIPGDRSPLTGDLFLNAKSNIKNITAPVTAQTLPSFSPSSYTLIASPDLPAFIIYTIKITKAGIDTSAETHFHSLAAAEKLRPHAGEGFASVGYG